MSNQDYINSLPKDVIKLPPELQNASHGLPKNWREIAKQNGWKYALFQSTTQDESRLVIVIPGQKYDRELLYFTHSNPANNDPTTYFGVQMQAIEKNTGPALARLYFGAWEFNGPNHTPKTALQPDRCIKCHLNGPRAIAPRENPGFQTEVGGADDVEHFNDLVVHNRPMDYSPFYNLKYFPSHLQVGGHTCFRCHDGKYRQSLAYSVNGMADFNSEEIYKKVVTEESMPPYDTFIPGGDTHKYTNFVEDDYYDQLKKWLSETKCSKTKSTVNHPTTDPLQNTFLPFGK